MLDILSAFYSNSLVHRKSHAACSGLAANLSTLAEIASLTVDLARPAPVSTRLAVN
jgi:hypothetical protein